MHINCNRCKTIFFIWKSNYELNAIIFNNSSNLFSTWIRYFPIKIRSIKSINHVLFTSFPLIIHFISRKLFSLYTNFAYVCERIKNSCRTYALLKNTYHCSSRSLLTRPHIISHTCILLWEACAATPIL